MEVNYNMAGHDQDSVDFTDLAVRGDDTISSGLILQASYHYEFVNEEAVEHVLLFISQEKV